MRQEERWNDQIYVSEESSFNRLSAVRLGQAELSLALGPSQVYTATRSFVIPSTISGSHYIYVELDSSNDVLEAFGENNNIGRSPDPVSIPSPPALSLQIEVNKDIIPTSLVAGQVVAVQYEVVNVGETSVSIMSWTDGIFLAMESDADLNSILENGILLQQIINNRPLDVQQGYSVTSNITVPYGINQLMYLTVVIDINEDLGDVIMNPIAVPAIVEDGPLPDLVVLLPSITLSLRGGQPALVHYEVENVGENTALSQVWYDALYLSVDALLDPFDVRLKTVAIVVPVGVNETYNQSVEIFVPFDLPSGFYYLFIQTDVGNHISELGERNNFAYQLIELEETVSTDIAISRVTAFPTSLNYGDSKFVFSCSFAQLSLSLLSQCVL